MSESGLAQVLCCVQPLRAVWWPKHVYRGAVVYYIAGVGCCIIEVGDSITSRCPVVLHALLVSPIALVGLLFFVYAINALDLLVIVVLLVMRMFSSLCSRRWPREALFKCNDTRCVVRQHQLSSISMYTTLPDTSVRIMRGNERTLQGDTRARRQSVLSCSCPPLL